MKITITSCAGGDNPRAASSNTRTPKPQPILHSNSTTTKDKPTEKRKLIAAECEQSEKKTKLYESLDEPVTLIVGVGSKTKSFSVHKNILSQTSSFFKAACKPEWMKPEDRVIRFPDDDVEAIRVMVYWMYSDELCVHQKHLDDFAYWTQPAQDAMKTHWGLFAKLYVIGDKYAIPRLQNHCIDAMLQSRHKNLGIICPAIIPFVYENTSSPSDPLRRLLVMAFRSDCQAWSFQRFIVGNTGICTDFFVDLAAEFFRDKDESQSTYSTYTATLEQPQVDFCKKFHKHNEGIPACNQFHKYHIIGRSDKAEAADATEEDMGAKTSGSMEPVVID